MSLEHLVERITEPQRFVGHWSDAVQEQFHERVHAEVVVQIDVAELLEQLVGFDELATRLQVPGAQTPIRILVSPGVFLDQAAGFEVVLERLQLVVQVRTLDDLVDFLAQEGLDFDRRVLQLLAVFVQQFQTLRPVVELGRHELLEQDFVELARERRSGQTQSHDVELSGHVWVQFGNVAVVQ